ncbi:MAG: hypothetical protein GX230_01285 [Lentisphaerae bacterium]|jgi:hypothetical protein|nr:hypothetical protein [Lentisphaerota bacterium]
MKKQKTGIIRLSFITLLLLFAGLGITLCGCIMWPQSSKPFAVTGSSLNWAEMYYTTTNTTSGVRLSLLGSGNIVLTRGTSSRLLNPFAVDVDSSNWSDYERDEVNLSRTDMQQIFQLLINRNVLKKSKDLPPDTTVVAQMHGRIDDRVFSCVTADPKLIEVVEAIIALFPPPHQRNHTEDH